MGGGVGKGAGKICVSTFKEVNDFTIPLKYLSILQQGNGFSYSLNMR